MPALSRQPVTTISRRNQLHIFHQFLNNKEIPHLIFGIKSRLKNSTARRKFP